MTTSTNDQREKRVAVARDVLIQLVREDAPLKLSRGVYLEGYMVLPDNVAETNLQTVIDGVQQCCEVCAIGAAFLSYVRLYDGVALDTIVRPRYGNNLCGDDDDMLTLMRDVFPESMLRKIERYYQCWQDLYVSGNKGEALRLIMQNVVDNQGDFVPEESWRQ